MCLIDNGEPDSLDLVAAHSCNNPQCVNPHHVRWDTQINNMADKFKDGTLIHGEALSFLTEREVVAMRRLYQSGVLQRRIAEAFDVSPQRVNEIVKGKTWKYCRA
jgi:predicted XRE-type DNA-binding protein